MSPKLARARRTVLLVEDDPDDARMVFVGLEAEHDLRVVHVRAGAEALQVMHTLTPDVMLVDHRLPDMTGVALMAQMRKDGYAGPIIMVSGVREDRIVASALAAGADDFLVKNLEFSDEVRVRLRQYVEA